MRIWSIIPFSVYVLWLLAFPMVGFLLPAESAGNLQLCFLVPHALSLIAGAAFLSEHWFKRLTPGAIVVTLAMTGLFPFFPQASEILLVLGGISAAFLAASATTRLSAAGNATHNAVAGLIAGNALLYLFIWFPGDNHHKFIALATLLFFPLVFRSSGLEATNPGNFLRYLPIIAIFNIISGLMYGFLIPEYSKVALHNGFELFFYIVAVLCGIMLVSWSWDILLAVGLLCSMVSYALLHSDSPLGINTGMFAMQASTGLIDLFTLNLILSHRSQLKACGYTLGAVCTGIITGRLITLYLGDHLGAIITSGNIILNFSVISLFMLERIQRHPATVPELLPKSGLVPAVADTLTSELLITEEMLMRTMPGRKLSEQERSVLECIVRGKTFKETAMELTISESSVKTYMKRIYEKNRVAGKEALIEKLFYGKSYGEDGNGLSP